MLFPQPASPRSLPLLIKKTLGRGFYTTHSFTDVSAEVDIFIHRSMAFIPTSQFLSLAAHAGHPGGRGVGGDGIHMARSCVDATRSEDSDSSIASTENKKYVEIGLFSQGLPIFTQDLSEEHQMWKPKLACNRY